MAFRPSNLFSCIFCSSPTRALSRMKRFTSDAEVVDSMAMPSRAVPILTNKVHKFLYGKTTN